MTIAKGRVESNAKNATAKGQLKRTVKNVTVKAT